MILFVLFVLKNILFDYIKKKHHTNIGIITSNPSRNFFLGTCLFCDQFFLQGIVTINSKHSSI